MGRISTSPANPLTIRSVELAIMTIRCGSGRPINRRLESSRILSSPLHQRLNPPTREKNAATPAHSAFPLRYGMSLPPMPPLPPPCHNKAGAFALSPSSRATTFSAHIPTASVSLELSTGRQLRSRREWHFTCLATVMCSCTARSGATSNREYGNLERALGTHPERCARCDPTPCDAHRRAHGKSRQWNDRQGPSTVASLRQ